MKNDEDEDLREIFNEFSVYCKPLVISAVIGFFYSFTDYWLLQKFGGAVQQGYYAVGARFSNLSLIATTSILYVFWKEIAEAYSIGNMDRVKSLYRQISRGLYFLGAVISCFLVPFSREILILLLGSSYQDAWLPLSLMFLYPIHQSMGQITGTMLLATGKTKTAAYLGIIFMVISIPLAYILIAPKTAIIPGFQMGAVGLALKMVGAQLVGVNLTAFFVAKYSNLTFDWKHQFNVLLSLLAIGFLCKYIAFHVLSVFSLVSLTLLVIIVSGIFYLVFVMIFVGCFPLNAGLNREQIDNGILWLRMRINQV